MIVEVAKLKKTSSDTQIDRPDSEKHNLDKLNRLDSRTGDLGNLNYKKDCLDIKRDNVDIQADGPDNKVGCLDFQPVLNIRCRHEDRQSRQPEKPSR